MYFALFVIHFCHPVALLHSRFTWWIRVCRIIYARNHVSRAIFRNSVRIRIICHNWKCSSSSQKLSYKYAQCMRGSAAVEQKHCTRFPLPIKQWTAFVWWGRTITFIWCFNGGRIATFLVVQITKKKNKTLNLSKSTQHCKGPNFQLNSLIGLLPTLMCSVAFPAT